MTRQYAGQLVCLPVILWVGVALGAVTCSSLAAGRPGDSYTSKAHRFFEIEREARREAPGLGEGFRSIPAIGQDDGIETVYRKLVQMEQSLSATEPMFAGALRPKASPNQAVFWERLEAAHRRYPGSAAIGAMYVYHRYRYQRNLLACLAAIMPYLPEHDRVPGVTRTLWYMFHLAARYAVVNMSDMRLALDLGADDPGPREVMDMLRRYWAVRLDPEYASGWTAERIEDVRRKLTEADRRHAARAWQRLVQACYGVNPFVIKARLKGDVRSSFGRIDRRHRQQRAMWRGKMRRQSVDALAELEQAPNTLHAINHRMRSLKRLAKPEDERVPNYDAIQEALGAFEADLVNLCYLRTVREDEAAARGELDRLRKVRPKSVRLLMLDARWALGKREYDRAESVLKRLLEIEPDNYKAQHLLIHARQRKHEAAQED